MKTSHLHRQRGVAVITALLLTTLAITIVASLFWQQQVQVRSIENQRLQLQKQWVLRGALDWTRLILGEDRRIDNRTPPRVDHLDEPWAVPLAETRLDQYVEKESASEVPDAALSGGIIDATSRFNLRNLCPEGTINEGEVRAFGKLLTLLQVNPALARATAELMASAQRRAQPGIPAQGGDAATPLPMNIQHVDDLLAVPGFTPELFAKVKDFLVVLPVSGVTKININTASPEVIAAKVATLSLSDAAALVAARRNRPFKSIEDVRGFAPPSAANELGAALSVATDYFLVNGNVRMNRAGMEMQALIYRDQRTQTVLWIREY